MAWIESHTEIERHRKTVLMAAELGIEPVYLSGHLHALWHNILEQQENGDLSKWPVTLVAQMAMYQGDPEKFVSLLKKYEWIDAETNLLHDWLDYAGKYLWRKYHTANHKKLKEIQRLHKVTYRSPKVSSKVDEKVSTHARAPGLVGLVGNTSYSDKGDGLEGGKRSIVDIKFAAFWKAYPRKVNKPGAYKAWKKEAGLIVGLPEQIMDALERHKRSKQWLKDNGQFIPHPATWLNQRRWEDELPVMNGARDAEPKGWQGIREALASENES